MNRLSLHILSLLRLYDRIALPGLGYVVMRYVPAQFCSAEIAFFPPRYELEFEPSEAASEERILNSYMNRDRSSRAQATAILNGDLSLLFERLESEGRVQLPGLGEFVTAEGGISFIQSADFNLPLPVIQLGREETAEEINEEEPAAEVIGDSPLEEQPELAELPELPETSEPRHVIPAGYRYHKPEYFYIPVHKKLAKIAACFLLVIIVGLSVFIPVENSGNTSSTASMIPMKVTESHPVAEAPQKSKSVPAKVEKVTATEDPAVTGASKLETSPRLSATEEEQSGPKYYAVVGTFKTREEAEKFVSTQKNPSNLSIVDQKYHYITVSSSSDSAKLWSQMPLIRSEYPDAWVLTM